MSQNSGYCRFFVLLLVTSILLNSTEGRYVRQEDNEVNEDEKAVTSDTLTTNEINKSAEDESQEVKSDVSGETTASTVLDPEEGETETSTMYSIKKMQAMGMIIMDVPADKGADDIQVHEPELTPIVRKKTQSEVRPQDGQEEEDAENSNEEDTKTQVEGTESSPEQEEKMKEKPLDAQKPLDMMKEGVQEDSLASNANAGDAMSTIETSTSTVAPVNTMPPSTTPPEVVTTTTTAPPTATSTISTTAASTEPPTATTTTTESTTTTTTVPTTTTESTTTATTVPTTAKTTTAPPPMSTEEVVLIVKSEENIAQPAAPMTGEVVKSESETSEKSSPVAEAVTVSQFTSAMNNNDDGEVKSTASGVAVPVTTTTSPVTVIMQSEKMETTIKTVINKEAECSEGDVVWRKKGCNLCVCSEEGFYVCRKEECAADIIPSLKKSPSPPIPAVSNAVDVISENSIQDFNETTSTAPTTTTTTTTPKPECYSGLTKTVDCNICVCSPDNRWACTKRSCIALTLREKASYSDGSFTNKTEALVENPHLDEDCYEGQTRSWDCNACVCHLNSWSCTQKKCPVTTPPPRREEIEVRCENESDVKSVGCNVCQCTRGVWVCSNDNCEKFGNRHDHPLRNKFQYRPRTDEDDE